MTPGRLVFKTALGFVGIGWSGAGLVRLILPEPEHGRVVRALKSGPAAMLSDVSEAELPQPIAALVLLIRRYAEGEAIDFSAVPIDWADADPFRRAIYEAARSLRHGEAVTYGELAERAGFPGMARETGAALGRNPVPLVIPCHRILSAGGRLGGFSAPGGRRTKQRLLAHEQARLASRAMSAQAAFDF
jgi:methylated-DNA-[protein]-cysteine S-methyltransferase